MYFNLHIFSVYIQVSGTENRENVTQRYTRIIINFLLL